MTAAETFLWPFLGFLIIAALASWWQARSAKHELNEGDRHGRGRAGFKERQEEIAGFQRSRERRAAAFAALALTALLYLVFLA